MLKSYNPAHGDELGGLRDGESPPRRQRLRIFVIADPWPESFGCGSVRWSSGCVLVRLGRRGIASANAHGRWAIEQVTKNSLGDLIRNRPAHLRLGHIDRRKFQTSVVRAQVWPTRKMAIVAHDWDYPACRGRLWRG